MATSLQFKISPSSIFLESSDLSRSRGALTICCVRRSDAYIPKREPFSRSMIERGMKEPSFIKKTENELRDYCSTLEGDDCYRCWRAYFELKDLEEEASKEDIEHLLRQAGGVKSLVGYLLCMAGLYKKKNKGIEAQKAACAEKQRERPFPVPDGLPKTQEEIEEEEKARLPDSPHTVLLRSMGKHPAWFSPPPDHETD